MRSLLRLNSEIAATNCRASNQWTAKSRDISTAFGDFTDEVGKQEDHRGEDTWR
jgi:hypothetical protein